VKPHARDASLPNAGPGLLRAGVRVLQERGRAEKSPRSGNTVLPTVSASSEKDALSSKRDSTSTASREPADGSVSVRRSATTLAPADPGRHPGAVRRTRSEAEWREHLGAVYRAHAEPLLRLLSAAKVADPESMLHEVFLGASDYFWQPQDPKGIPALLVTVARGKISDERRFAKRHPGVSLDPEALAARVPDPEQALAMARRRHALERALQSMPPASAALVEEVDLDGGSPKEIAARIGAREGAVRMRASRARSLLADLMRRPYGKER
jgi:RNA polymerase sigma factor (sigma-70 family)